MGNNARKLKRPLTDPLGTFFPDADALDNASFDEMLRDKQRRIIEAGNVFPAKPSDYGPFSVIPNFMRGFLFRVLSTPQIRAYLHICTFLGQTPLGYVTGEQIMNDIGISSKKSVYGHTKQLVALGFLLQQKQARRISSFETVNFYQRPAIEYTIAKLLRARKINADLMPLNANGRMPAAAKVQAYNRVHGKTVRIALEKMLGREEVARLATYTDERQRADEMATALEARLIILIAENKSATKKTAGRARRRSARQNGEGLNGSVSHPRT